MLIKNTDAFKSLQWFGASNILFLSGEILHMQPRSAVTHDKTRIMTSTRLKVCYFFMFGGAWLAAPKKSCILMKTMALRLRKKDFQKC